MLTVQCMLYLSPCALGNLYELTLFCGHKSLSWPIQCTIQHAHCTVGIRIPLRTRFSALPQCQQRKVHSRTEQVRALRFCFTLSLQVQTSSCSDAEGVSERTTPGYGYGLQAPFLPVSSDGDFVLVSTT